MLTLQQAQNQLLDLKIRIISMPIVHKSWLKSKLQILLNPFSYLLPNSIRANWRYKNHRTYRQEKQSDLVLLIFFLIHLQTKIRKTIYLIFQNYNNVRHLVLFPLTVSIIDMNKNILFFLLFFFHVWPNSFRNWNNLF